MHDSLPLAASTMLPGPARDALTAAIAALDAAEQLCESAELSLLRGTPERAREQAEEAARLAQHTADPAWELAVLMRASDVLDRLGEHVQAIALHCRALSLITQDNLHEPQTAPAPASQTVFSTTWM